MDGGTRQTQKLDPEQLLGLVALTAGRERLRPTCEMPKLELATLLSDPATGRATPMPVGVITEETSMMQRPNVTAAPEEPQLAKGSSGIVAMPKELLEIAHEIDMTPPQEPPVSAKQAKRATTQIEAIKGSFSAATDASPRRSQPFAAVLESAAARQASQRVVLWFAMGGAAIGLGLARIAL